MGRLTPPPPGGSANHGIEYADGATPCPRCNRNPPAGDPWTSMRRGAGGWRRVCLDCALRYDDRLQPQEDA